MLKIDNKSEANFSASIFTLLGSLLGSLASGVENDKRIFNTRVSIDNKYTYKLVGNNPPTPLDVKFDHSGL